MKPVMDALRTRGAVVVVGTDTGAGKTQVSIRLLHELSVECPLAYWKPIATGSNEERDTETVRAALGPRVASGRVEVLPELYLFPEPLSPHLAARLAGAAIAPRRLVAELERLKAARPERPLLIEGAGGLLVPLTDEGWLWGDLLEELALPVLLVARSTLGTINHTLLTLEALRQRAIEPLGVVMFGPPNPENRRAIERFGATTVLAEWDLPATAASP